jgi:hypothetical protein
MNMSHHVSALKMSVFHKYVNIGNWQEIFDERIYLSNISWYQSDFRGNHVTLINRNLVEKLAIDSWKNFTQIIHIGVVGDLDFPWHILATIYDTS